MNNSLKLACFSVLLSMLASCQSAQDTNSCDEECLADVARQYMTDVVSQDWSDLPWADTVRYTENNVAMMIGDGFWGAGPGVQDGALVLADASTGNVVWFGITEEHGQAAYHGLRLKAEDGMISEVESYLGREGTPDLFADTSIYSLSSTFSEVLDDSQQSSRSTMINLIKGYYASKEQNDGTVQTNFTDDCQRVINGVSTTSGDHWAAQAAAGCEAQLAIGVWKPVDRIRATRFPVVDIQKGVVVALSLEDHATRYVDYQTVDGQNLQVKVEYPNTRGLLELFKISEGEISRIEGVSVFLPYYIHDLWEQ